MRQILVAAAVAASALPVAAQTIVRTPSASGTYTFTSREDDGRAMLGVSTSTSGRRDTLGLLITSVTAGGPAEKAGVEEGNRLISINGVSLKLSRDDADDDYMQGVNQNRLTREMRKVKAGDEVTLEVWGGGRSRSVKVKTVSAADLSPRKTATVTSRDDDRAAIGIFLTSTGNKRDTSGVFVQQVVEGGPAEKAGIVEGDRIATINGIDLRVPREDAGDWTVSSSRVERAEREVRKLTAGQSIELSVVSGGRARTVRVTAVKASDLPGGSGFSYRFGPTGGELRLMRPNATTMIMPDMKRSIVAPRIRIQRGMNDHDMENFKDYEDFNFEHGFDRGQLESMLHDFRMLGPKIREQIHEDIRKDIHKDIREDVLRDVQKSLKDLKFEMPRIRDEIDEAIRDHRVIKRPVSEKIEAKVGKKVARINL
jgi:serine protease Do